MKIRFIPVAGAGCRIRPKLGGSPPFCGRTTTSAAYLIFQVIASVVVQRP